MYVIIGNDDPLIINNNRHGYLIDKSGTSHAFDNINYVEENAEWPEGHGPFYQLIFNSKNNNIPSTMGIEISNVQFIVFDRIRGLEEI